MAVREIVGLGVAFVVLAGISVAIVNGQNTARILQAGSDGFASMLRAATGK